MIVSTVEELYGLPDGTPVWCRDGVLRFVFDPSIGGKPRAFRAADGQVQVYELEEFLPVVVAEPPSSAQFERVAVLVLGQASEALRRGGAVLLAGMVGNEDALLGGTAMLQYVVEVLDRLAAGERGGKETAGG